MHGLEGHMYQPSDKPAICVEPLDQKPTNNRNLSYSGDLHNLIGIDHGVNSAQGANDLTNASSLVTSLSSSREGSPNKKLVGSSATMNAWIPSAQLRPAIAMAHLSVFAA
ncbi:hypothetical protein NE237_029330 [Protea cynaroides]|uniref:Uncharacterized protein n=1 Tax=Protea cynaroides TaxID=273540 RepID=A0A9Q0GRL4_9MAGN|nr:hypothetical protein NE237_029330 [Protea cynaroides]